MAQGGTLPIKREQSVSLYNTTGVIERHKNIYFSPFITPSVNKIKDVWLEKFETECPAPSDYTDITISQWSPEDRTLVVRGNVDDFRLVTEHGLALNYLILTRKVYDNESTFKTYYYAFFITSVSQAGSGSVRLTLEPDHFTNVFYLHNEEVFSGEGYYDAFNGKMKNCYVARQHYNRVKVETEEEQMELLVDSSTNKDVYFYPTETGVFVTIRLYNMPDILVKGGINSIELEELVFLTSNYNVDVTNLSNLRQYYWFDEEARTLDISIYVNSTQSFISLTTAKFLINYNNFVGVEDNLPIFSQIEESFKYKRQFREHKEWLNYGNPISEEEKTTYLNTNSWSDLTSEQKTKALKLSTAFIHITLNTGLIACDWSTTAGHRLVDDIGNKYPNVSTIQERVKTVVIPIYNEVDYLKAFYQDIKNIFKSVQLVYYEKIGNNIHTYNVNQNISLINGFRLTENFLKETSLMNAYILSAYISKESSLINHMIYTDSSISMNIYTPNLSIYGEQTGGLNVLSEQDIIDYKLIPFVSFVNIQNHRTQASSIIESIGKNNTTIQIARNTPSEGEARFSIHSNITEIDGNINDILITFLEPIEVINFNLDLTPNNLSLENLTNGFYDTVLTFNPYSFYSISYLGRVENILNKLNYYEEPVFTCNLLIHVTDVFKLSFTPKYKIDNLYQYMYSEGIEQTLTNQITVITSKYADYIVANHTQMKNQFAVNDVRSKTDMLNSTVQAFGTDIPSAIGKGAMAGGWQGALIGGASKLSDYTWGLLQNRISWASNNRITEMNQKAKLSDLGTMPSNLKQVGSDISVDLSLNEVGLYLNHYSIDEVSYNSICKYLERFGYMVNIYDTLNVTSRVGWDYVQLASFDYEATINTIQEESIRQIFAEGVTLLHDKSVLTSGHNYETILEEVI